MEIMGKNSQWEEMEHTRAERGELADVSSMDHSAVPAQNPFRNGWAKSADLRQSNAKIPIDVISFPGRLFLAGGAVAIAFLLKLG